MVVNVDIHQPRALKKTTKDPTVVEQQEEEKRRHFNLEKSVLRTQLTA